MEAIRYPTGSSTAPRSTSTLRVAEGREIPPATIAEDSAHPRGSVGRRAVRPPHPADARRQPIGRYPATPASKNEPPTQVGHSGYSPMKRITQRQIPQRHPRQQERAADPGRPLGVLADEEDHPERVQHRLDQREQAGLGRRDRPEAAGEEGVGDRHLDHAEADQDDGLRRASAVGIEPAVAISQVPEHDRAAEVVDGAQPERVEPAEARGGRRRPRRSRARSPGRA